MMGGRAGGPADTWTTGFTLVELMVVLVILGVLTSVSVTALPSLRAAETPSLADRFAYARRKAISTGSPVILSASDLYGSSVVQVEPSVVAEWRFLPDGRGLGPGLDQRTGRLVDTSLAAKPIP